ncbi:MAG: DNA primase [Planctomycetota bacterium]
MSRYVEDAARRVKEATDIVELVSAFVPLQKVGARFRALCPFHREKTPSFYVNPQSQFYHCFGCHKGGDVFDFVCEREQVTFPEALEILAKRAGLSIERAPGERSSRRERLTELLEAANRFFRSTLSSAPGMGARDYLLRRHIATQTIADFELGLSPPDWQALTGHLQAQRFGVSEIEAAGLARQRATGGHFDLFRGRVMIPIRDGQRRLRGFGGRVLDQSTPKYLNSPETELFQKKSLLFAFAEARPHILQSRRAIVMEGYMDVILGHQEGVKDCVAALGTAISEEHATLLKRHVDDVVLIFDGDAPGIAAAERSLPILLAQALHVSVVIIPDGEDPGDLFAAGRSARFQELVENHRQEAVDFLIECALRRHQAQGLSGKLRAAHDVLGLLTAITDPVQRELLVKRIAEQLGVSEAAMRGTARVVAPAPRTASPTREDSTAGPPPQRTTRERAERELLCALVGEPALLRSVDGLVPEDFTVGAHQELFTWLRAHGGELGSGSLVDLAHEHPALKALIIDLVETVSVSNSQAVVREALDRAQRDAGARELSDLKERLRQQAPSSVAAAGDDDLLRGYVSGLRRLQPRHGQPRRELDRGP